MNRTFRKTALLMSALALLGLGYSSNANAAGSPQEIQQASKKITGTVVDAQGPVIGASVVEKGTTNGTVTDFDGNFSLSVKTGATIVISFIGYETQEIKVGNRDNIQVTMKDDNAVLEEVVVVGYGVQKKKLVTGATVQVKGEDIAKLNTTNALTAMQASTPGVNITQSSSQPGKGFKVNIRGVGTIGNSSPLLIIDGINAGTADDGLNGLNPNDIESIDVLKDAASAAIYGARAANGVILVTTKQGKEGKLSLQYDGFVGWSNAYKVPAMLGAKDYMSVINETYFNTYGSVPQWNTLVPQSILDRVNQGWNGTDWFKAYENKNALQFSHAVTLNGGTDRSKFSISLNYSSNEGIMGGDNASSYKRYGGRINSDHVVLRGKDLLGEEHDLLTIGENVSYWYHNSHDLAESNGYWNIMQAAYIASPLVEPYDNNGKLASYKDNGAGYSTMIYGNPLNHFLNGGFNSLNENRDFGVGATFYWIVEPIKNLKYRGQFNTGYSGGNSRSVGYPYSSSFTSASANYTVNQSDWQSSSFTIENTLSYVLPTFGKHNIDVLIGQSIERSNWSSGLNVGATVTEENLNSLVLKGWNYNTIANYDYAFHSSSGGYDTPMQGSIASFFGRANWNYDDWNISNEKFMESTSSWLSFLKLRASWGQNGNCQIGNFYYLSNIGFSPSGYPDYGYKFSSDMVQTVTDNVYTTGAYAKNVPNPDVTWETSEQLNIGLDARFLGGRLGLNFDWYKKTTKDWLVQAPMNVVLGYEEPAYVNAGDVENKGFEVALSWRDQIGSDFTYHANVNFATNKNEVTRLANNSGYIDGQDKALFENSSWISRVEVGHPIGYFNGMSYSGVWQNQAQIDAAVAAGKAVLEGAQPGDLIWDDYNKDGMISLSEDRHEIGNPHPDVTLGASLGFEWKGFDFGVTGSGAFGMQVMQCYRTALLANPFNNYSINAFDRWHGEGTSNSRPRLAVGTTNDQWVSTLYMEDADYFRIQNITLGYNFSKLWKSGPFSQLRLYVQAQNLYTFTGYSGVDPEIGSSGGKDSWARGIDVGLYPQARTFIVGASIKF